MDKQDHPIRRVSLRVLEDWGMMLVDELDEVAPTLFNPEEPVYVSWINLKGVITGSVSIIAQEEFLRTLAANLLGDPDHDLSDSERSDAFREMANVLAGNFLTEAYGDDVVFELINPDVKEIPYAEVEDFTQRKVVFGFLADDAPVAITFRIDNN